MKFIKSLQFRILAMLILIGIIPAVIATRSVVRGYEERAVKLRGMNVRNQCEILANQLVDADYFENTNSDIINSELTLLSNVYFGRIMVIGSDFRIVRDTYDLGIGRTNVSAQVIDCFRGEGSSTAYDAENGYIEVAVPVSKPDTEEIEGVILVSVSTNEIAQNVRILERNSLLIIATIIGIVMIVGYLLSRYLIRPLHRVTNEIESITDGFEEERISVTDYTETEQITNAFNQLLSRVKKVDDSRQEFVSNVSHELKTPLASMKVLADSLVGQENVPNEIYREFMEDISHEIDRENGIIQDLLEIVRMEKRANNINIAKVNIGNMLEDILQRLRPIAGKRNIELSLDRFRDVEAEVDSSKLTLAFTNLIENAIKYNVEDGWVRVSLNADHKFFYVTVADSGIGISDEDQAFIFERFYRVDKSHSTEVEGTGLGLAIVKSAVTVHHGVVKVISKPGAGTSFQTRIPLLYEQGEES